MDDFSTFARDFGLRPQGKAAPMTQSRPSDGSDRPPMFDDVFGGPPKYSNSKSTSSFSDFDYDSIFKMSENSSKKGDVKSTSSPVYDKPMYDEDVDVDIFDGLPGVKSKSTSGRVNYDENVFATMTNQKQNRDRDQSAAFDDLLGNLGQGEKVGSKSSKSSKGFDDLLPGFGSSSPQRSSRLGSESNQSQKTSSSSTKPTSVVDDPFDVLKSTSTPVSSSPKVFTDPLDEIGKLANSAKTKANNTSVGGPVFDDIDPLDGFGKSAPGFSTEMNKEPASSRSGSGENRGQSTISSEPLRKSSFRESVSQPQKMPENNFQEFHPTVFDMPGVSTAPHKSVGQMASPSYVNAEYSEINTHVDMSPRSEEQPGLSDDAWLTVSEIPLFTQPTTAPPPSRPPPPIPGRHFKSEAGFYHSNSRKKGNDFSSSPSYSQISQSPNSSRPTAKSNMASPIDELESFAMGRTRQNNDEYSDAHGSDEMETNSSAAASAAAMKEAMDKAEAKFRHAKEVREREHAKTARNRESVQIEKEEQVIPDEEREYRENEERLERERRQRDEEEKERRRLERERERAREEREKARQAVERATREARERAAVEARERAAAETRRKSERVAVERAQAEARERAERAAVQRAQAEARERAAADAKGRAERAAAEAREKANAEAREKAAVNARAEAEARRRSERAAVDRAAAEARERAAAAARMNQQKNESVRMNQQQVNDNDLESIFGMSSRPSSAPRPRANSSDPTADPQFQNKVGSEGAKKASSVNTSANIRKTSSATNFVDDLSSIFGGTSASSGNFQEVEGETEERRRARLERHQRTQERAAKALAEKNQRDLQSQRDQEERHRISETLDIEIRRWAAGKEGNLRALLSTLQYVLWPGCGWTPVSLTDLITGASVKKVYRKATLCIHPDKVQQKGANLQQKYIAEKVFDLLKEAWNKFNSEELF